MNFLETKEYIKKNNRIDISKFNRVSDITNMIDFINAERREEINRRSNEEISNISKFLADSVKRKIFLMGVK